MKFWEVKCTDVSDQLDAWEKANKAGHRALKAIAKSVGANNVGDIRSWFSNVPQSVAFKFDGTVDASVFTKQDKDGWRQVKSTQKDLKAKIQKAIDKFVDMSPIYKTLKIAPVQFTGSSLWMPKFAVKNRVWYFSTNDCYKGCDLVERVSDVEIERIFP